MRHDLRSVGLAIGAALLVVNAGPLLAATPAAASRTADALRVEGWGFAVEKLGDGSAAFSNRPYVWKDVPAALRGWQYTRTGGGLRAGLTVRCAKDTVLHVATTDTKTSTDALAGWEKVPDLRFCYTDAGKTVLQVFRRAVKAGESVAIPQVNWTGTLVLAPELAAVTATTKVPGTVIFHSPAASGLYVGSPGIAVLPDGAYLAKCDLFGPKSNEHQQAITLVFRSEDKGKTWKQASRVDGLFWSNVFVHGGAAWMIGTQAHHGRLVIMRSDDGGRTWTKPTDAAHGLLTQTGQYHTAPMPMVVHGGRIWRAVEDAMGGLVWGHRYRAMMISAPLDANLLSRKSWTLSNCVARDPNWLGGAFGGWLEGNAVLAPNGRIVDMLRVDSRAGGKAAIVDISADGRKASFDPKTGFVDFPGGSKKFSLRRDGEKGRYWSLVNYVPPAFAQFPAAGVRNTLALVSSADLRSWTVHCILLHHGDRLRHGFQYPDWLFDGDDIIAAIRTAYDDGQDGAHNAHDANYLTFHRFRNFRKLTMADSAVPPASLGMPKP